MICILTAGLDPKYVVKITTPKPALRKGNHITFPTTLDRAITQTIETFGAAEAVKDNSRARGMENVKRLHPTENRKINAENIDSRIFRAGQLRHFINKWEELGAPKHILHMIKGYRIPFVEKPPLIKPHLSSSAYQTPVPPEMTAIINQMKLEHVLEAAPINPSFLSRMFLRPKKDGMETDFQSGGAKRICLHTKVSSHIGLQSTRLSSTSGLACKIDISQAYFHLPTSQSHRRYPRLIYKGQLMQMTCLPFGLASARGAFASITA